MYSLLIRVLFENSVHLFPQFPPQKVRKVKGQWGTSSRCKVPKRVRVGKKRGYLLGEYGKTQV